MSLPLRRTWPGYCLLLFLLAGLVLRVLYAWPDPDPRRFWDERVSIWNVQSLVGQGRLQPNNGLYPTLSYLPHAAVIAAAEAVHRATGAEALEMLDPDAEFGLTGNAVLAARFVSLVAGTLTVGLVFVLGRRLASPLVGLVAAAILSASWTHLFVSVKFKPDVLAVLFAVVAFLWLLDALERPGLRRWALAGVGVGLATSSKYLGASMAIPVAVAALWSGGLGRRTWSRLAVAGAATVGTFVALNPWLGMIAHDLSRTQRDYAAKAERAAATPLTLLGEGAAWVVQDHRLLVALFVGLGCLALAARAFRGRELRLAGEEIAGPGRAQAAALLAAIAGHALFYAFATPHFRSWNFLPVIPFTAFAGAWAMVATADAVLGRLAPRRFARVRPAVWAPVLLLFLAFPLGLIYAALVPTTWEVVAGSLGRHPAAPAVLVYGTGVRAEVEREAVRPRFVYLDVESLETVRFDRLERADAVVVPERLLRDPEGAEAALYRRLTAAGERPVERVAPRWFRIRGPALRVVGSLWKLDGEPLERRVQRPVAGEPGVRLRVPLARPLAAGETISVALRVERTGRRGRFPGSARIRGVGEAALYRHRAGRTAWLTTSKLRVRRPIDRLTIELPGLSPQIAPRTVKLHRWRRVEGVPGR